MMKSESEQWKPIKGFKGLYAVSNHGRVKSLARETKGRSGSTRQLAERILKPSQIQGGYLVVKLCKNSKGQPMRVHRLVAEAFLGPPRQVTEAGWTQTQLVAHNDGNPANNHASNLRYATVRENAQDRVRHGTQSRGGKHPNAKLTECDVISIRRRVASGEHYLDVASDYPVSHTQISAIVHRRVWRHVD